MNSAFVCYYYLWAWKMYARIILLWQDFVRCACALQYNKGVSVYCTQLSSGIGKYDRERERDKMRWQTSGLTWSGEILPSSAAMALSVEIEPKRGTANPTLRNRWPSVLNTRTTLRALNIRKYTHLAFNRMQLFMMSICNSLWVPRCFWFTSLI